MTNAQQVADFLGRRGHPAVSLILSTHPAWPGYKVDREVLKNKLKETEAALLRSQYDRDKVNRTIYELFKAADEVDFGHLSKGLVLFASADYHKVLHLPFEPVDKIIIDRSFEVRDLIYSLKRSPAFAVITISENKVRVFEGQGDTVRELIIKTLPQNIHEMDRDYPSRVGNFTATPEVNKEKLEKFIHRLNVELSTRYRNSDMLLIIAATAGILSHFRSLTHTNTQVIDWIKGNFDHITPSAIRDLVHPSLEKAWKMERERTLSRLDAAVNTGRTASGPSEAWRAAAEGRVDLLVVEKDRICSGRKSRDGYTFIPDAAYDPASPVPDIVDELIGETLLKGGDVAFVEKDDLADHQGIAAVTRF